VLGFYREIASTLPPNVAPPYAGFPDPVLLGKAKARQDEPKKRLRRVDPQEAEIKVAVALANNRDAGIREVSKATGLSVGRVHQTKAWQVAVRERKKPKAERLTQRHLDQEAKRAAEDLQRLILEQKADQKADEANRKRNPLFRQRPEV